MGLKSLDEVTRLESAVGIEKIQKPQPLQTLGQRLEHLRVTDDGYIPIASQESVHLLPERELDVRHDSDQRRNTEFQQAGVLWGIPDLRAFELLELLNQLVEKLRGRTGIPRRGVLTCSDRVRLERKRRVCDLERTLQRFRHVRPGSGTTLAGKEIGDLGAFVNRYPAHRDFVETPELLDPA